MNPSLSNLFSVAEVELIYRNKIRQQDKRIISEASHAYDIFLSSWDMEKINLVEQFSILLLDRSNTCLGLSKVATGGVTACFVDPRIVFGTALKARACGLIMAHNHPSGKLKPSNADIALTSKFKEAGKLLEISVLDHLIVTPNDYFSFANEGLL